MTKGRVIVANTTQPRTIRKALFDLEDDDTRYERLQEFVKLGDSKWVESFGIYNKGTNEYLPNVLGYCNEEGMMINGANVSCNNGISPIYGPAIIFETDDDGELISMSDEMAKKVHNTFKANNRYVMDDVNLTHFNKEVDLT